MAFTVQMPALGESVTEGTVTRWLKQEGDRVEVDEPLLEVSTDKVDTEIPSPTAGTLLEIKVDEDETVEVGAELAVIGSGDAAPSGGGEQQKQHHHAVVLSPPDVGDFPARDDLLVFLAFDPRLDLLEWRDDAFTFLPFAGDALPGFGLFALPLQKLLLGFADPVEFLLLLEQ